MSDDIITFTELNEHNSIKYSTSFGVGYIQYQQGVYINMGFLDIDKRYSNLIDLKNDIKKVYILFLEQLVKNATKAKIILESMTKEEAKTTSEHFN